MKRIHLSDDYSISSLIKGSWHLAGGHGAIDPSQAIEDMRAFVENGITTFDCADIYTGVEELIGKFINAYEPSIRSGGLPEVQIHTKYVPDYNALSTLTKHDTEQIIDRSLQRLNVERLDLVQFAWWDYSIPGHVETALHLSELQQAGKIRHLGVTNYDAFHLQELIDAGVHIISNQVQYSILDRRPEHTLIPLCKDNDIFLLCYGAVGGGFISDRYFGTAPDSGQLENRSLTKYQLIIEEFGGYADFQHALSTLRKIADRCEASIAEIAICYILQRDQVGAAIIGARNRNHLESLLRIDALHLNPSEVTTIDQLSRTNFFQSDQVYRLERQKTGKHGSIMKYNLNGQRT